MNPRDLMLLEPCHTSDERNFVMSQIMKRSGEFVPRRVRAEPEVLNLQFKV
jgi:hypothetical protein